MQYNIFVDVQLSKEVIKRSKQKTDDKVKNNKYCSVKHYSQETKEWATGTLQNTTQETKDWATGTLENTIHRKLKNEQQEPYKTLYTGN